jgi:serine/threonine protein kinase
MSGPTPEDRSRIAEIVARFEASRREGSCPRPEEFLTELAEGPARDELLRALRELDQETRDAPSAGPPAGGSRTHPSEVKPSGSDTIPSPDPPPQLPELPDYEVLDLIGQGAMGQVCKARHRKLRRLAALKVILPGRSIERFRREASLIAGIKSPHVVGIHDFRSLDDGRLVLIMEYIDGCDLRDAMKAGGGTIPEERAARWMSEVCEGMIAASAQGIIHRDLKPANILIDRDGRALVADFGLARSEGALSEMTLSDSVMGTPHYMAPEQAEDPRGVDTRADIYSFGATFYHALTGSPPFDGNSIFSILLKHKTEPLISPGSRNPSLSDRLCAILERCLAKSPADRFPTFGELRRQLESRPGPFTPWDMTEDPALVAYLERYQSRRDVYLRRPRSLSEEGDTYGFPRGRVIRILTGNIVDQEVDVIVSSDDDYLSMGGGVSAAIARAAGESMVSQARGLAPVRPGRAVVTLGGSLPAKFVFHGVTLGYATHRLVIPSRNLIAEIMASCFYHADSLYVQRIAFPLLGTGAGGFSPEVCLDTMFQFLARMFLHGLSCVQEARVVLFAPRPRTERIEVSI